MRQALAVMLALGLAACDPGQAPQPARPLGANAPQQVARATLGQVLLEARLVAGGQLPASSARQYGIDQAADNWVLMLAVRDRQGDAVAAEGLHLEATVAGLGETPKALALEPVHTATLVDYIGQFRARAPDTLSFVVTAQQAGQRAQMQFVRELPRQE